MAVSLMLGKDTPRPRKYAEIRPRFCLNRGNLARLGKDFSVRLNPGNPFPPL